MGMVVLASVSFGAGGALMRPSHGFTAVLPTIGVLLCFVAGAFFLTRAVNSGGLARMTVIGLGIEAVIAVSVGGLVLGERLSRVQGAGVVLILSGVCALRLG